MPYTLSVTASNGLNVNIPQPLGQVEPLGLVPVQLTVQISQPLGVYTAVLRIEANAIDAPADLPIEIEVIPEVYRSLLPVIVKK